MEFVVTKKNKSRSRKRNMKNKRRLKRKLEVKAKLKKSFAHSVPVMKNDPRSHRMDAHSFWKNYKVAQDWQQKHSIAWWKSRCYALEYENSILRQKIRDQAAHKGKQSFNAEHNNYESAECFDSPEYNKEEYAEENDDEEEEEEEENLEFEVDKDMMDFLEQSIRHKIELKRSRELTSKEVGEGTNEEDPFVSYEARILAKSEDARMLYGEASSTIMAMEAALQATTDRHKDRANPHYWPIIPLKP